LTISSKEWRDFLLLVGVRDFVVLCPRELRLADQDLTAGCDALSNCARGPGPDGPTMTAQVDPEGSVLDDWHSPDLEDLLSGLSSAAKRDKLALCAAQYLEDHWVDEGYADRLCAAVRGAGAHDDRARPSSFARALRNSPWLPAENGTSLAAPAALWARCDAVLRVFGTLDVPYLDRTLGGGDGRFIRDLGVQVRPTVGGVLRELVRWSKDTAFQVETADMSRIYAYLSNEMVAALRPLSPQFDTSAGPPALGSRSCLAGTSAPADVRQEIQTAFNTQPLVFLPRKARAGSDRRSGCFCSLTVLRLRDPTGVVEELEGSTLRVVTQHYTKEAGFDAERHAEFCVFRPFHAKCPDWRLISFLLPNA
jgi:hypothetical protein